MRRNLPPRVKLTVLALLFCSVVGGWSLLLEQQELGVPVIIERGGYVRLHILANSDSVQDQQLKLKVRDAIIAYLTPYVKNVSNAKEANEIIMSHQETIVAEAKKVIAANGANYAVAVQMGTFPFPVRSYGSLELPAGDYQAVRILIGQGAGQNWWCVLFPPLCFVDGANTVLTPINAAAESGEQKATVQIRWKIAELFNK